MSTHSFYFIILRDREGRERPKVDSPAFHTEVGARVANKINADYWPARYERTVEKLDFELEMLIDGPIIRPKGACGTIGWSPFPWEAVAVEEAGMEAEAASEVFR